ncbi:hypothetical protein [Zobellella denitrificans]|nr:hypothetical protein [Zobellella denitrificans]
MLYFDAAQRRIRHQRAAHLVDTNLAFAGGAQAEQVLHKLQQD